MSHREQNDWGLLLRQMKNFSNKFDVVQINENPVVCKLGGSLVFWFSNYWSTKVP